MFIKPEAPGVFFMREKFFRFMAGRNGADQLSRVCSYIALALIVVNLFTRNIVVWTLAIVVLIYAYFRIFSKNVYRRREENARYMALQNKAVTGVRNWRDRMSQRRDYAFFRCPGCRAMLRVPRGKGKLRVTCRKCGAAFERRT